MPESYLFHSIFFSSFFYVKIDMQASIKAIDLNEPVELYKSHARTHTRKTHQWLSEEFRLYFVRTSFHSLSLTRTKKYLFVYFFCCLEYSNSKLEAYCVIIWCNSVVVWIKDCRPDNRCNTPVDTRRWQSSCVLIEQWVPSIVYKNNIV